MLESSGVAATDITRLSVSSITLHQPGTDSEGREIGVGAGPIHCLLGERLELTFTADTRRQKLSELISDPVTSSISENRVITGFSGDLLSDSSTKTFLFEYTLSGVNTKDSPGQKWHVSDVFVPNVIEAAQWVEYSFSACFGRPILSTRPADNSIHGCVDNGLGNCISRQNFPGPLAQTGIAHQLARISCRPVSLATSPISFEGQNSFFFLLDNATAVLFFKKERGKGRMHCPR